MINDLIKGMSKEINKKIKNLSKQDCKINIETKNEDTKVSVEGNPITVLINLAVLEKYILRDMNPPEGLYDYIKTIIDSREVK